MKPAFRLLDIGFNVAVAHLADKTARGLRGADIALHTYEELIRQIETHPELPRCQGTRRSATSLQRHASPYQGRRRRAQSTFGCWSETAAGSQRDRG
ncbi:MAG: hypothetical protein FD139_3567 [Methylocystaceae bacterium]|nr:MAG: hypothetical protein FD172_3739 [Methylocystaceae bacterium]TXT42519.1 MAG: hypothetical protein FD139_3567 [Methylocystaceae bacterium]